MSTPKKKRNKKSLFFALPHGELFIPRNEEKNTDKEKIQINIGGPFFKCHSGG